MAQKKLTGRDSASLKYDLLTALGAAGLYGSPTLQTSVLRLIVVITARYNWSRDEVSIGHAELAGLWGVNERTVKREMKRLTGQGFLVCIRPGVRGRVGAYRLDFDRIASLSKPTWPNVGPAFASRMEQLPTTENVVRVDFGKPADTLQSKTTDPTWDSIQHELYQSYPALYENWFSKLCLDNQTDQWLSLTAPNAFIAEYVQTRLEQILATAVRAKLGPNASVRIFVAG